MHVQLYMYDCMYLCPHVGLCIYMMYAYIIHECMCVYIYV